MNDFAKRIVGIAAGCESYYDLLGKLVDHYQPHRVLELGTGTGKSAATMMKVLGPNAILATINWPNPPSGDDVGVELAPWRGDSRCWQILGDTRERRYLFDDNSVDFLFIDSGTTHNYDLISAEWKLYESVLTADAIVCVDDLDFPGGGIRRFWDILPFEKVELPLSKFGFGVLQYVRKP